MCLPKAPTLNQSSIPAFWFQYHYSAVDRKTDLLEMDHFFLKNMIDKWIQNTSSVVNTGIAPRAYRPLDDYQEVTLEANTVAFPSWHKLDSPVERRG